MGELEMNCPSCKSAETRTTETRVFGPVVMRRRSCEGCALDWSTQECVVPGSESRRTSVAIGSLPADCPQPTGRPSTISVSGSGSLSLDLIPVSGSQKQISGGGEDHDGFEAFWEAYGHKVGKADAKRAWQRKRPPLAKCLETLAWQRRSLKWASGYIPNPATWINQGRWDDEPPTDLRSQGYSEREIRGMNAAERFIDGATRFVGEEG